MGYPSLREGYPVLAVMRLERVSSTGHPYAQHQPLRIIQEASNYCKGLRQGRKFCSAACRFNWQHVRPRLASATCPNPAAAPSQHQSTPPRSRIQQSVDLIQFRHEPPNQCELSLLQSQVPIALRPFSSILMPRSSPLPSPMFRQDLVRVRARQFQKQGLCHGRRQRNVP